MNSPKPSYAWNAILTAAAVTGLIFAWGLRVLPMQDLPDWLYQGFAFSLNMQGSSALPFQVVPWPVPNTLATVLLGLFDMVVSPVLAGRIVLTLALLLFAWGAYILTGSRLREGRTPLFFLPLLLLLNIAVYQGQLNYLFGLGELFLLMGYTLRFADKPGAIHPLLLAAGTTLLFYTHGIVLIAWAIFALAAMIAWGRRTPWVRWIAGHVPAAVLVVIYAAHTLGRDGNAIVGFSGAGGWLHDKASSLFQNLTLFPSLYPFLEFGKPWSRAFGFLNLLFLILVALICGVLLIQALRGRTHGTAKEEEGRAAGRMVAITVGLYAVVFLSAPASWMRVVDPGGRFLLPALFLLLAGLAPWWPQRLTPPLRIVTAVFLGSILFFEAGYLLPISQELASIREQMREDLGRQPYTKVEERLFRLEGKVDRPPHHMPLMRTHDPLQRLDLYLHITDTTAVPVFTTGILRPTGPSAAQRFTSVTSVKQRASNPERVLIVGGRPTIAGIAILFGRDYKLAADRRAYMLLQLRSEEDNELDTSEKCPPAETRTGIGCSASCPGR